MDKVERIADQVAAQHGRDPWRIADAIGLPVFQLRLPGRYREVYFGDGGDDGSGAVVVAPDASQREARTLLAHGLGHHFLHTGNRLASGSTAAVWFRSNERQADDFAACLLICGRRLRNCLEQVDPPGASELGELFDVEAGLLARRMQLLGRPGAKAT